MKSILVSTNSPEVRQEFTTHLSSQYKIDSAMSLAAAVEKAQKKRFDFVCIDLDMLTIDGTPTDYRKALQPFWSSFPSTEVIIMCPQESLRDAVKAVKAGANTYLNYPINPDEIKLILESIHDYQIMESELDYLRTQFWHIESLEIIHTNSPLMAKVYEKIRAVAPTKSTVLMIGETGTGKGVLAGLIHNHSHRKDNSFISVHCGAIPDTLVESELFGHEKGAFTGADKRKLGKFEIAKGGTIFLDEIGTVTPPAQIKLLNVLQDQIFQRIGGEENIHADVRIIAATNADLKTESEEGRFRKDLYYRLNVFPIEIPPLKQRIEDIPHIVNVILAKLKSSFLKEITGVHPSVMEAFMRYPWPGNIRELENLLERAYILETSSVLTPDSFPSELLDSEPSTTSATVDGDVSLAETRRSAVDETERRYLRTVLSKHSGRIKSSAVEAGISTRQLHKLMTKHGIRKEEFKR